MMVAEPWATSAAGRAGLEYRYELDERFGPGSADGTVG